MQVTHPKNSEQHQEEHSIRYITSHPLHREKILNLTKILNSIRITDGNKHAFSDNKQSAYDEYK
jgi:hypothetical protein